MTYKISDIEKLYPNWYNESSDLSYEDQKWIWENVPLPETDEQRLRQLIEDDNETTNANGSVSGNVNGVRRFGINQEQDWSKSYAIAELNECNSKTSPKDLALLLEKVFCHWNTKDGHWLWIAQRYTARTINWVMADTAKVFNRGGIRKNPAAYFTHCIQYRKKRMNWRKNLKVSKNEQK